MPSYERWRCFRIVDNSGGEDNGIIGGLRNAMSRGQDISQAKRSLINAGYNSAAVEEAARQIPGGASVLMEDSQMQQNTSDLAVTTPISKPIPITENRAPPFQYSNQSNPYRKPVELSRQYPPLQQPPRQYYNTQANIPDDQTFSKTLVVILSIVSVLILIGAAILGLYWDKLFA